MDEEKLSWRARLAKRNINILNVSRQNGGGLTVYYEFMYHPKGGQTKWCKTMTEVGGQPYESPGTGNLYMLPATMEDMAETLAVEVLDLRKELEA